MTDQQGGLVVTAEERARVESRSVASDSLIQFQAGRIAVLEVELQRQHRYRAEQDALVEELEKAVVELTRQVIDLGGEPAGPVTDPTSSAGG